MSAFGRRWPSETLPNGAPITKAEAECTAKNSTRKGDGKKSPVEVTKLKDGVTFNSVGKSPESKAEKAKG